jgi:mannonate dehydratase
VGDALKHFGDMGKLFKIHYRNVDKPLPHFVETFIDDGYFDMYQATRVLEEVGYNGVMIPDHIPEMAGDGRIGYAYSIAYMKAHVDRARAEVALWK